jgi:hypothetical protein
VVFEQEILIIKNVGSCPLQKSETAASHNNERSEGYKAAAGEPNRDIEEGSLVASAVIIPPGLEKPRISKRGLADTRVKSLPPIEYVF